MTPGARVAEHIRGLITSLFQSSPSGDAGRKADARSFNGVLKRAFQSSPSGDAGRKIMREEDMRVQDLFQSSPSGDAGRKIGAQWRVSGEGLYYCVSILAQR